MAMAKKQMSRPEQAVILCGGLGTRLRPYTNTMPKPMILCNGKPFLWHLLRQLNEQGIKRFVLLTGYLSEKIENYFGDGNDWKWDIEYHRGPVDWDTGKRVWESRKMLKDCFLLLYSDNFAIFSLNKVFALHKKYKNPLTIMVSKKIPGNISLNKEKIVQVYDNDRTNKSLDYVEIGYMIVEKDKMFDYYKFSDCSFTSILSKMAANKDISAWVQNDQYHSISDPERWKKTETYLTPKKILMIDRDGVINKKAPQGEYISKWEDFEWIPETRTAMKLLSAEGFKFIVITNQAGIARGMVDKHELEQIHQNMQDNLNDDGIEIIDIYVCEHHWEEDCLCRKPKPGMLLQASYDHLFRLDKTLFIGDDIRDCQAAHKAECGSIFIGEASQLENLTNDEQPVYSSIYMRDSVSAILNYFSQSNEVMA